MPITKKHKRISRQKTFTITTGHQLNILTGPLFFIYKICDTITTASELNAKYTDCHFVPVYWMASEDHDIEEIRHIHLHSKTITWNTHQGGSVGDYVIDKNTFKQFKTELLQHVEETDFISTLLGYYECSKTLREAHFKLVHFLFKEMGLVIFDPYERVWKTQCEDAFKKELLDNTVQKYVSKTSLTLREKGYKTKVNPREINLFFLDKNHRNRIVFDAKTQIYSILNTDKRYTKDEILQCIEESPEKFSPNVLFRPIYQQILLPNIIYIGGYNELAYWMQLTETLPVFNVVFPILKLRNSFFIFDEKAQDVIHKYNIQEQDLFQLDIFKTSFLKKTIDKTYSFSKYRDNISALYQEFSNDIMQIENSLQYSILSERKKFLNFFSKMESKIVKIQKNNSSFSKDVDYIKHAVFSNEIPQERMCNIFEFTSNETHWLEFFNIFLKKTY